MYFTLDQNMTTRVYNAFSLILLLQFLAIVCGTLLTSAMLKVNGYPELEIIMESNFGVYT